MVRLGLEIPFGSSRVFGTLGIRVAYDKKLFTLYGRIVCVHHADLINIARVVLDDIKPFVSYARYNINAFFLRIVKNTPPPHAVRAGSLPRIVYGVHKKTLQHRLSLDAYGHEHVA